MYQKSLARSLGATEAYQEGSIGGLLVLLHRISNKSLQGLYHVAIHVSTVETCGYHVACT